MLTIQIRVQLDRQLHQQINGHTLELMLSYMLVEHLNLEVVNLIQTYFHQHIRYQVRNHYQKVFMMI